MTEPEDEFDEAGAYSDAWDESGSLPPQPTSKPGWDKETDFAHNERTQQAGKRPPQTPPARPPPPAKDPRATVPDLAGEARSTLPEPIPGPSLSAIDAPRRVPLATGAPPSTTRPSRVAGPPPPPSPPPPLARFDEPETPIAPRPPVAPPAPTRVAAPPADAAWSNLPSRSTPGAPPAQLTPPFKPPPSLILGEDLSLTVPTPSRVIAANPPPPPPVSGVGPPAKPKDLRLLTSPGMQPTQFMPDSLQLPGAGPSLPPELSWSPPPPAPVPVRPELAIQATPALLTWAPSAAPPAPAPPRPELLAAATPAELKWSPSGPEKKAPPPPTPPPPPPPTGDYGSPPRIGSTRPINVGPLTSPPLPSGPPLGAPPPPPPPSGDYSPPPALGFALGEDDASLALEAIDEALAAAAFSTGAIPAGVTQGPTSSSTLEPTFVPAVEPTYVRVPLAEQQTLEATAPAFLAPRLQPIVSSSSVPRQPPPPSAPPPPAPSLNTASISALASLADDLARDAISTVRPVLNPSAPSLSLPPASTSESRRASIPVARDGNPTQMIDGQAAALQYAVDQSLGLRASVRVPDIVLGSPSAPAPPAAPPSFALPLRPLGSGAAPPPSAPPPLASPSVQIPGEHEFEPPPPFDPRGTASDMPAPYGPGSSPFNIPDPIDPGPISNMQIPLQSAADSLQIANIGDVAPEPKDPSLELELDTPARPSRASHRPRPNNYNLPERATSEGTSPVVKIAVGLLLVTLGLLVYVLLR